MRGVKKLSARHETLRWLGAWSQVAYPHAVNLAMARARSQSLVMLAERNLVSAGWLAGLAAAARARPAAGVISAALSEHRGLRDVPYAREGCLFVPRRAWDALGGFDDRFRGRLGAEDFCLRARQRGFHVVETGAVRLVDLKGPVRSPEPGDGKLMLDKWFGHHLLPAGA